MGSRPLPNDQRTGLHREGERIELTPASGEAGTSHRRNIAP